MLVAAPLFAAAVVNAQPPASLTDSGCVTGSNGRVECRFNRIIRGPDSVYRFERMRMDSAMMKRAVLGLELRSTGTKRDSLGVFVENVVPGGPAEKAGIVEGDRIAAINGVDLKVSGADVEDPYMNGIAAHRLAREVQKLAPGARVDLRVYSGGRYRDVQVTTVRASDLPHRNMGIFMDGPGVFHFEGPGMGMRMNLPEMLDGVRMMLGPRGADGAMPHEMRIETRGGRGGTVEPRRIQLDAPTRMRIERALPMLRPRPLIRV